MLTRPRWTVKRPRKTITRPKWHKMVSGEWCIANGTHAETWKEWRDDYQTLAAGLFHCFFDIPQQETFFILNAVSFLVESFFPLIVIDCIIIVFVDSTANVLKKKKNDLSNNEFHTKTKTKM